MRSVALVLVAGFGIAAPGLAHAYGYCAEPREPMCLQIWSDNSFDMCKMEVQTYLKQLDDWVACISNDADDRAKKVVDRFNCHAKGNSFCM